MLYYTSFVVSLNKKEALVPKQKPTHLYKLEDISGSDALTYQLAFTSGEVGSSEFRNLVFKKINELLQERCGNSGIGTRIVLTGRLTYITVSCKHAEARDCIVDGVAAAFAEPTMAQLSEEEKLTTMVARDVTAFGCQIVTISYMVVEGWAVRPSTLGQLVELPLSCTHDPSTKSITIRSGNPLYGINDEAIARVVATLRASVARAAKITDMQRLARALGGAVLAMPDHYLSEISDLQTGSSISLGGGRLPSILRADRVPRLASADKVVQKPDVMSILDRLRDTYIHKDAYGRTNVEYEYPLGGDSKFINY